MRRASAFRLFITVIGWISISAGLTGCTDDIGIDSSEPRQATSLKVSFGKGMQVSVVRHYVVGYDIELTLGPCGGNNLVQLKRITYIPNHTDTLAHTGSKGLAFNSPSDWIGPYWISAAHHGNAGSGFTGGWHAYNGDATGSPTARTTAVSVVADGSVVASGSGDIVANEVMVTVSNRIQAGNTKEADGSGREVLSEVVTYRFHSDTVAVSVVSTALEDLTIDNYYGMQSCFGGTVNMYSADSMRTFHTDGYHGSPVRVSRMECSMDDGHQVVCLLDSTGLGAQDRYNRCTEDTDRQYCFTSPFGKAYFRLVGEVGLSLSRSDAVCWSGAYVFRERR